MWLFLTFDVEIRSVDPIDCLAVRRRGSYFQIDQAFTDVKIWYSARDYAHGEQEYLGVLLSDPSATTEPELRSMACFDPAASFLHANIAFS